MEFWCYDKDPLWHKSSTAIGELAENELRTIRLIPDSVACLNSFVLKIPRSYPVYEIGYKIHLEEIKKFVSSIGNLFAIGRNGAFKYNNQDHSMMTGILAAKNLNGGKFNLWQVNSDAEYHESAPDDDSFRGRLTPKETSEP